MDFVHPAAGKAKDTDAAGPVPKKMMGRQVHFETPARSCQGAARDSKHPDQASRKGGPIAPSGLGQDVPDYLPFYICESEVSAAIAIG
jgi:hypothetical protein